MANVRLDVPDEIWTSKEVAAYWKVSERMVTAMACRNEIPGAFRPASYGRFRKAEILAAFKPSRESI